jgi:hypothetical protein
LPEDTIVGSQSLKKAGAIVLSGAMLLAACAVAAGLSTTIAAQSVSNQRPQVPKADRPKADSEKKDSGKTDDPAKDVQDAKDAAKEATDAAQQAKDAAQQAKGAAQEAKDAAQQAKDAIKAAGAKPASPPVKVHLCIDKIVHHLIPRTKSYAMYVAVSSGDAEDDFWTQANPTGYIEVRLALRLEDVSLGDNCTFKVFLDDEIAAVGANADDRATATFKITRNGKKNFRYTSKGPGHYYTAADDNADHVTWHYTVYWHVVED